MFYLTDKRAKFALRFAFLVEGKDKLNIINNTNVMQLSLSLSLSLFIDLSPCEKVYC